MLYQRLHPKKTKIIKIIGARDQVYHFASALLFNPVLDILLTIVI